MRAKAFCIMTIAMVCGVLIAARVTVTHAEPMKFKAVAFLPANNANVAGFNIFMEKVNNKFKDSITIELLGGPEVIPPFQLHEAVKSGAVDMCLTSCGYYPSLLWEAQTAMFTNKNHKEVAETGYYEIMEKLHEEKGLVWLGPGTLEDTFHLYVNSDLQGPGDFAGKKIRVFPPFIPFMKALDAAPINLPMGDIYTAMERGAIDGFVQSHLGFVTDFSWHEVTKFAVDYPLYKAIAVILVNPAKWNKLSPDVRKAIKEFKNTEVNQAIADYYANLGAERWKLMMDKGVKPLEFSEQDGKLFLDKAYESAWEHVNAKSPELGPKLQKMLVK